jgi:DNA-binding Lrp family transcriptional regulator
MELDRLDRTIIQHLTSGIASYQELAKKCRASRNTVYRRIKMLQEAGVLKSTISVQVDIAKLGLSAICLGINTSKAQVNDVLATLSESSAVKNIWRCYSSHNVLAIALCLKGQEGQVIDELRTRLEAVGVANFDLSICYTWEKFSFQPFNDTQLTDATE